MRDLQSSTTICLKGGLFLFLGVVSGALLLADTPTLRFGLLLALCVWSFCRAYYFAFYVIEHYVDSSYRFSGLLSFVQFVLKKRRGG